MNYLTNYTDQKETLASLTRRLRIEKVLRETPLDDYLEMEARIYAKRALFLS